MLSKTISYTPPKTQESQDITIQLSTIANGVTSDPLDVSVRVIGYTIPNAPVVTGDETVVSEGTLELTVTYDTGTTLQVTPSVGSVDIQDSKVTFTAPAVTVETEAILSFKVVKDTIESEIVNKTIKITTN